MRPESNLSESARDSRNTPTPSSYCREDAPPHRRNEPRPFQPIAVVGMGMRLPGDVRTAEQFWQHLLDRKDGRCPVPTDRYNVNAFDRQGSPLPRQGHFLSQDLSRFDASFFSVSAHEAARMDPQQRMLLEVVWECLENAGVTDWEGRDVGCYVGTFGEDWLNLAHRDGDGVDRYHPMGTGSFALANHLSYKFDFRGPSMTIETGCSSSLVAVHEACQALGAHTCSAAIVAGTNLIVAPTMTRAMTDNLVLSPEGVCHTFDARAAGYGRAEAVNCLYLQRLEDAVRDGSPIRAVIRGTATNSDGGSSSITAPSLVAQERLIRQAYRVAGIPNIEDTGLFECHGTGTIAGDTAECTAIGAVLAGKGAILGAVKPNFGHSEGASGITSVIKAVLALEHRIIPPNAHFERPNPRIPFKDLQLSVPTVPQPWPSDRQARVSVNGFGIGGSNAHLILEAPPQRNLGEPKGPNLLPEASVGPRLLVVSARDASGLQQRIEQVTSHIVAHPEALQDLAFTLGARRKHLPHRAFALVELERPLEPSRFSRYEVRTAAQVHFVFTGQGAQWAGMGQQLLAQYPGIETEIERLQQALDNSPDPPTWSLVEQIRSGGRAAVADPEVCQCLCTTIQIAVVNLLAGWGIWPSSVIGHSSGEIAAAYSAGAITSSAAILIAYYRGKLARGLVGSGEMASVGLSAHEVTSLLTNDLQIACINSPHSVTVSGSPSAVDQLVSRVRAELPDIFCRKLRLAVAYHSTAMKQIGPAYEGHVACCLAGSGATVASSMIPMVSTVSGATITDPRELRDAAYWRHNLESPVQFEEGVRRLLQVGAPGQDRALVEVGPHAALAGPLKQIWQTVTGLSRPSYTPTLIRNDADCRAQLRRVAGHLHVQGVAVDLQRVNGPGRVATSLQPYPWQHSKCHWQESRLARDWRLRAAPYHELLGQRCGESTDLEPSWRNQLRLDQTPWLADHRLQGQVIFPAAGYVAMAGEAMQQARGAQPDNAYTVRRVLFKAPLALEEFQATEVITTLRPVALNDITESEWYAFAVTSFDGSRWVKNCHGQVRVGRDPDSDSDATVRRALQSRASCSRPVAVDRWYRAFAALGLPYGATFRGLDDIRADPRGGSATATVTDQISAHGSRYAVHPTVIDQCLQLLAVATAAGVPRRLSGGAIPASLDSLVVGAGTTRGSAVADVVSNASSMLHGKVTLADDTGRLVLALEGGRFFRLDSGGGGSGPPLTTYIEWKQDIAFQEAQSLLPRKPVAPDHHQMLPVPGILALLSILESSRQLQDTEPQLPHLVKWKDWILAEAANIAHGHYQYLYPDSADWAQWPVSRQRELVDHYRQRAAARDDDAVAVTDVICLISDHCEAIARGDASVLDLLLENDRLTRFYSWSTRLVHWGRFLSLLGHANPLLRVLEIGAGTGSATANALASLVQTDGRPLFARYTYTDVSAGFLSLGRQRFGSQRNMEYKTLDISHDPCHQGFCMQDYDLVIASNVLHATPDLSTTLRHVHSLLVPGGRLLLHELNLETRFIDYVMGTLPGWWVGEADGRVSRPYIAPPEWDQRLRAAGFTGTDAWLNDVEPPFQIACSIISSVPRTACEKPRVTLLEPLRPCAWVGVLEAALQEQGYSVHRAMLDQTSDPSSTRQTLSGWVVSLLEVEEPFLVSMTPATLSALQQYLSQAADCSILWVTRQTQIACDNPDYGLALGFARCLRHEWPLPFSLFEIDVLTAQTARAVARGLEQSLPTGVPHLGIEYEHSLVNGDVYLGRARWGVPVTNLDRPCAAVPRWKLEVQTAGLLDSLQWVTLDDRLLKFDEVEVEMQYVGLNFKDVMVAMGLVGATDQLGLEGSGIIRRVGSAVVDLVVGDEVIVARPGILQTMVITDQRYCRKLPSGMSLEEGAAVSSVFATAIYSLVHVGQLRKGQSVLIHSACGGVGLAAIEVCHLLGATVFATVGSQEKIDFLVHAYQIPRGRIFHSRSTSFRAALMAATQGRGVDLVLNSLAGKMLHASWECVAQFGKMVELGKRDFLTHGTLDLSPFDGNRAFIGVDLAQLADSGLEVFKGLLSQFESWYVDGKLCGKRPRTCFEASRVVDAFRLLQKGTHIGKVVIQMPADPSQRDDITPATPTGVRFPPDVSYLLVGGLGGIGRAVSTWMVEQGARHLVYLSETAGSSPDDRAFLHELSIQGCHAQCVAGSVTDIHAVQRAVSLCQQPLKGVLHLALCLRDAPFLQMTYDQWSAALAPKVQGTWNLHHATSSLALDFFVAFGSLAGECGRHGQSNYGAANTFLDAFTQYRRECQLPSALLALGVVGDMGFVSRDPKLLQALRSSGTTVLSEADVLEALQIAIRQCRSPSGPEPGAQHGQVGAPLLTGFGFTRPLSDPTVVGWGTADARFSPYVHVDSTPGTMSSESATNSFIKDLLERIDRDPGLLLLDETGSSLAEAICQLVTTFSVEAESMDLQQRLAIEIDSLMGIEVRNWSRRNLNIEISLPEISRAKTVGGLSAFAMDRLRAKYLPNQESDEK